MTEKSNPILLLPKGLSPTLLSETQLSTAGTNNA